MPQEPGALAKFLEQQELVLVGCGRMGSALLDGWLAAGVPHGMIQVIEPAPSPELLAQAETGTVLLNPAAPPLHPAAAVIAVKPQQITAALPILRPVADRGTLVVSIAAGITLARLEAELPGCRAVRAMPNTPGAIGQGITALIAADGVSEANRQLAGSLLGAAGSTVWLDREEDMDSVTAVSGSGPAYVFALIETLARAGEAEGLSGDLALALARQTVIGAGALAQHSDESPQTLRHAVTSPGGTTAAGLQHLLDPESGLEPLMRRTVQAAAARSRELADS